MGFKKALMSCKVFVIIMCSVGILLTAIGIAVDVITPNYETSLNVLFTDTQLDDASYDDALENGYAMNVKVEEEGIVLLKNENNILPLKDGGNINTYGVRSAHLVLNSAGSAAASTDGAMDLKTSLEDSGFTVNSKIWSLIDETDVNDSSSVNEGGTSSGIAELELSKYDGAQSWADAKAFSEYAIVTVSRYGGEGADSARTGYGTDGTLSYLDLSSREISLMQKLHEEGFKVILLVNSSYAMELGSAVDEYCDAALWIGGVGIQGAKAIGEVLKGTVNPSGALVDTYTYDLTTSSTFITSDNYKIKDTDGNVLGGYTNYAEDIYVGYKWYETAAAEGFWGSTFAKSKWNVTSYGEVVQYPFGYGLSYTTFEEKITKSSYSDGKVSLTVKVTNTGDYAGKDVVELYVEVPYVEGGVEKSKVSLCGFTKTDELAQGKSTTVTLTVSMEDIASWNSDAAEGVGAYILDAGHYYFYLSENAHSWASISTTDTEKCYDVNLESAIEYSGENKRSSDEQVAVNELKNADVQNGTKITTVTRANDFANAEATLFTASTYGDLVIEKSGSLYEMLTQSSSNKYIEDYEGTTMEDLLTDQDVLYTLDDLIDTEKGYVDWDDEKWTAIIDSLSVEEMTALCGTGGWSTIAIEKINKLATTDIDGPFGLSNLIKNTAGVDVKDTSYCTEVVMASTWNQDLITELGEAVGAEANATGTAGWYAPGANTHRTPFGGRNAEYFSEDSFLSGVMLSSEVSGVLSTGTYVYAKHFAFNDTEANRTNCQNCYMTEQTAREIYLKPYEMACKNETYGTNNSRGKAYKLTGLMISYMWFEEQWVGQDYNLCTTILRGEWGYHGMNITDNAAVTNWIKMGNALYGGTDLMLVYKCQKLSVQLDLESAEAITALKTATKNILYTYTDAQCRRGVTLSSGGSKWPALHTAIDCVLYIGGGLCIAGAGLKVFLKMRKRESNVSEAKEE